MSSPEPLSRSRPKRSSAAETEKKMQESLSVEAAPPIKESDLILPEKKKPKTPAKAEAAAEETAEAVPKADGTAAFGKLILFGEHFVVYKVPALVAAVAASTTCEFSYTDEPGLEVIDDRPAVEGYKVEKKAEADEAIAIVLRHFELDPSIKGMRIKFGGDLTAVSGIGASAAQVVALARAISGTRETPLTEEEVNAAGYEGEKGYHGTPSGIDNTAATYGGVLRFQRTEGEPIFTMKKITSPVRIVYASTGITASTSKVVGDVRAKKEADPAWFDALIVRAPPAHRSPRPNRPAPFSSPECSPLPSVRRHRPHADKVHGAGGEGRGRPGRLRLGHAGRPAQREPRAMPGATPLP